MFWKRLFATKSLEMLHEEMAGENRLRRVLGPIGLTSLGIGAIIGAGIFVMAGRVAANDAGPGIILSLAVAAVACGLAAFCYAEFASMAPVAGSAYTYAYATLGELPAWIIGWDLILEYAVSAATVAASWSKYFNELLINLNLPTVPDELCHDPFSHPGAWFNLPAVLILAACTFVLVIGIRESAASNTALVILKLGVVLFVILVGWSYVRPSNWTDIPVEDRKLPEQRVIPGLAGEHAQTEADLRARARRWAQEFAKKEIKETTPIDVTVRIEGEPARILPRDETDVEKRTEAITDHAIALLFIRNAEAQGDPQRLGKMREKYAGKLPTTDRDKEIAEAVLGKARERAPEERKKSWGLLGYLGINEWLAGIDDATRTRFMPYGLSGVMLGAALMFFAFLGFDSISTHSEEAIKPQRDVPFGILASLVVCTILYVGVAAVITGMVAYPEIDVGAAVASAFRARSEAGEGGFLQIAAGLIAAGGLAGMTSVLLITFLSQARIFLAMARDGLMPRGVFAAVHERYRTPHISTIVTGSLMCVVAAFTPIEDLEEMVNIGTFFAFVVVCAAVLILRIKRPDAPRPFRCPLVYVVAPVGIVVNLGMMLFLAPITWLRLLVWLLVGFVIYFTFGYYNSALREREGTAT